MELIMKKILLSTALISTFLSVHAIAEEIEVTLAGTSGADSVAMTQLLKDELADEFKEAGISINYQIITGELSNYLTNALSAGTAPDLFYVDVYWAIPLYRTGKIEPIPMDKFSATKDAIIPTLNNAFTVDDTYYGIPKDFNTLSIIYNKDIFDEAGVEYPDNDDTWDDFKNKLAKIHEEIPEVHGVCIVPDYPRFAAFSFASGWKIFNDEGKIILDDNFKEGFEYYASLLDAGAATIAADQGEEWTGGCMANETSAVAIEGAWMGNALRDNAPNMEYGAAKMPINPRTNKRGNFVFTVAWSVAKQAENKEAAYKALEILTTASTQQWVLEKGWAIPSRTALQDNPFFSKNTAESELSKIVFDSSSDGHVYPYSFGPYGGKIKDVLNAAMNSVMLKEKTVDEAIAAAQEEINTLTGQ